MSTPVTGKGRYCFGPKSQKYHLLLWTVLNAFQKIFIHTVSLELEVGRADSFLERLNNLAKVTQPEQPQDTVSSMDSIRIKVSEFQFRGVRSNLHYTCLGNALVTQGKARNLYKTKDYLDWLKQLPNWTLLFLKLWQMPQFSSAGNEFKLILC